MRPWRRRSDRVGRRDVDALRAALADSCSTGGWIYRLVQLEHVVDRALIDDSACLDTLLRLRLATLEADRVTPVARLDLARSLLVASDLQRDRRARDWVVGPGPASFTLARHVRPHGHGRLLDLGAGSGIQGLLLGGPRTGVVAVDLNPRAVAFTRWNAKINGRPVRAIEGDFLGDEPDRTLDGRFQTVVANPPYVIGPDHGLVYRDSTLPRDEVGERTVDRVARALAPGGRGHVLCNWIDRGARWSDAPRAWIAATDRDGVAIRLATLDAAAYAALWTRDVPPWARRGAIEGWTAALAAQGIGLIHMGIVVIARRHARRPVVHAITELDTVGAGRSTWRAVEAALPA